MPRIRQLADKYARQDMHKDIKTKMAEYGYGSIRSLAEITGISASTLAPKLRSPDDLDKLSMDEIRRINKALYLDEATLLRFVGTETKNSNKYAKENEKMKKLMDWITSVLTSHYDEAVDAGLLDLSGQGRDKYGR